MPNYLNKPFIDWDIIHKEFQSLQQHSSELGETETSIEAIIGENDKWALAERTEKAGAYAARLDATLASCLTGHAFVNGKHFDLNDVSSKPINTCIGSSFSLIGFPPIPAN